MVDTTPYNPENPLFTMDKMLKILLGAVDAKFDAVPNKSFGGSVYSADC